MKRHVTFGCLAVLAVLSATGLRADGWEAKRRAAVNRPRTLIYNTDGCDMLYYRSNLTVSVEDFVSCRLAYTKGTRITTLSYCPQSAGFGHFTCRKAGEAFVENGADPKDHGGDYNASSNFFALGTDALEMACDYAHTNGLEVFVSIRVNDTHDAAGSLDRPSPLFPRFKRKHPEFLMGRGREGDGRPPFCNWSAVDFAHSEVRAHMRQFVRELVENYDVDGVEYDFNRHMQLFKTVAWGAEATAEQLDLMTGFMRELKAVTEEVGRRRGRPIVIAMRTPDSVGYCRAVGIDLERWLSEKLVDLWIGAGYFQLNPWVRSVELVRRHGVRFYASLDESRVPRVAKRRGLPVLPGRMTAAFYAARMADAMASGCDGVSLFNLEYDTLRQYASVDPRATDGLEKIRFAVERGTGGYRPWSYLKDGGRFANMPQIDPGEPRRVAAGETVAFELFVGDAPAPTRARLLTNLARGEKVVFSCNGRTFDLVADATGLASADLPAAALVQGMNAFAVTFAKAGTLNDFALSHAAGPYRTYLDEKGLGSCGAVMFEGRDGAIVCGIKGWYRESRDGGRTWKRLYPFTKGASTNLLRLKDGRLLSIGGETCENIRTNSLKACNFYAYFSSDEGKTWDVKGRVPLSTDNRRLYVMNDRVMRLSTGRILVSFSLHPNELLDQKLESVGWVNAFYSDDEGATWREGRRRPTSAADQLCEPNVFEKRDGSLVMLARTGKGYLYRCDSTDGGESWSEERPTTLRSACAPFYMKKDPFTGWTFIAWDNSFPSPVHQYPRSPLSLAVTRDEGETWEFVCDIENDPMSSYGYPSIHFTETSLLVTYYEELGVRNFNGHEQRCKLTILNRGDLTVDRVEKVPLR